MRNFIIITDFQLNRFSIAQEFCENIEVDESCQGTCHLVKTIKKKSTEEEKSPFTASNIVKIDLLYLTQEKDNNAVISYSISRDFSFLLHDFDAYPMDVFHPPKSSYLS